MKFRCDYCNIEFDNHEDYVRHVTANENDSWRQKIVSSVIKNSRKYYI